MKQTSQRSLLFRQNVNRTEAEWVHFLDGYRKALIEFDMKKFGDDWHTAEDLVEEIFLNIVREPRITALRPQDSFRHVLINMCMQKHKSFTKPWRRRLAERLSVALCLTMRTQDDARREIAAGMKKSPRVMLALVEAKCRMIERAAKVVYDCLPTRDARVVVTKSGTIPGLVSASIVYP